MLRVEHGEHAGDAIARQTEFVRLRSVIIVVIVIVIIIVRGDADRQHLAHRRVGELIVQPGGDPFRLRDPGDGPAGQFGQPAANGDGVLGRQGGSAANEGQVDATPRRLMCSNAQYSRHSSSGRGRVRR